MIDNPLLATGLLLFFGYWGGRIANRFSLPRISGYLIVGLLFSPSVFGLLGPETVYHRLHFINDVALSIIAYNVGGSLDIRGLKGLGRTIGWITWFQALGAFMVTFLAMVLFLRFFPGFSVGELATSGIWISVALMVGAISAATAPGAVLAVISEVKASGEFTNILLGVIALDDALTIIFFSIAGAVSQSIMGSTFMGSHLLLLPFYEIGLSVIFGLSAGLVLAYTGMVIERTEAMLMVVLGVLFITCALASMFHASSILAAMVVGFVIINHKPAHQNFFRVLEPLEDAVFGLFFTLAGAHVDISILRTAGVLAVILLLVRMAGKQLGVMVGAKLAGASEIVKRYLGLALFPQAGVTIGLVLLAQDMLPEEAGLIVVNAMIGSVILNEFIAPVLLHHCLRKAGQVSGNKLQEVGSGET